MSLFMICDEERGEEYPVIRLDEKNLSMVDRLGLAYCRLNSFEWDPILGPKPEGFDNMPKYPQKKRSFLMRTKNGPKSKLEMVNPAKQAIEAIIGEANISRCLWKFDLCRTEEDWLRWYITKGHAKRSKRRFR